MKKPDLGQTLAILANVGVLFGILLLVYELAQNRQMIRAQTRTTIAEGLTDYLMTVSMDERVTSVLIGGDAGELTAPSADASDIERRPYDILMTASISYYENVHYQYRMGLYDETEFAAQRDRWR